MFGIFQINTYHFINLFIFFTRVLEIQCIYHLLVLIFSVVLFMSDTVSLEILAIPKCDWSYFFQKKYIQKNFERYTDASCIDGCEVATLADDTAIFVFSSEPMKVCDGLQAVQLIKALFQTFFFH
jgi:hypothetical protein